MISQKPTELFGITMDPDAEDFRCYNHTSSYIYNRDTCQMSPLLFESDTEDSSQSTAIKCYQNKTITPSTQIENQQSDMRNVISSQLVTSSQQHNQCCSETLLDSTMHRAIVETKGRANSAYISPSPRITRSKWLRSRILTRSAKRLHKISELTDAYSESPKSSRNSRTKTLRNSSDGKQLTNRVDDVKRIDEEKLIESIRTSEVRVVLERLKFPFFQNPHRVNGNFVQPNIVMVNGLDDDEDGDLDFLNRRLSSEVQVVSERRTTIISISSSESTIQNVSTTPQRLCQSPDLFESSSASNLCSQNSIDFPNGQVLLRNTEPDLSGSATSTPNHQQDSTLMPSIFDLFDRDCGTPNKMEEDKQPIQHHAAFEITVNEVFDNVIYVADSEETLTPHIANATLVERKDDIPENPPTSLVDNSIPQPSLHQTNAVTSGNLVKIIHLTESSASQEVTPKKRPEMFEFLNKSVGARPSTSLNRTKWLSKPRSGGNGDDRSNKVSNRCRRLDLLFQDTKKQRHKGNVSAKRKFSNLLLTSSEDEDS